MDHPLEPDRGTEEHWLAVLGGFALDHVEALKTATALGRTGAAGIALAERVSTPIGEDPLPGGVERIRDILEQAVQAALVTAGPGYLAYIPGGGLVAAAMADLVAGHVNRYTGLSAAAPGPCRLEADVLRWLCAEFGLGPEAHGLLTSGGSMANFSAIVTARHHHFGDDGDFRDAVAYTSSQVHHSVVKSFRLAGLPSTGVRAIAVDERFRMIPFALEEAIAADRAAGRKPFAVVSSAGTTNTGAIDPLADIADVCHRHGLWHHVDGAYGGAFVLCEAGRVRLGGIERADSITFDPHKGMFLPYGTGCLLVRDAASLLRAHGAQAQYLQDFDAQDRRGEPPNPTDLGPELSRDYRGLRLWLPLMLHGARAFRAALAEKLALAQRFHDGLAAAVADGLPIEIVDAPQLSTVAFRLSRAAGESLDRWNRKNAAFLVNINGRERVYLSSTVLPVDDGAAFTLRVCVLSFRTHADRIDAALEDVRAAATLEA